MVLKEKECAHEETSIVVLYAWDVVEKIGYKCDACKEIIKTQIN